jgi:RNA polymerase sigma-70 factor (ECF subfamily)
MPGAAVEPTPLSLLKKLQEPVPAASEDAWRRFVKLYTPLLMLWARRVGASEQEAPDLVQDVFLVLAREMPRFRHDPAHCFRSWLWTMLVHKWRDRVRHLSARPSLTEEELLDTLACPDHVEVAGEGEYRACLIGRALELMRETLGPDDWRAGREYLVRGRPAGEVAEELGLTVNQVYLAVSRIRRRLRVELEGLLD